MTDPIVEYDADEKTTRIVLDPDSEWREVVYGGFARVTLMRGCPHEGQPDRIVAVDIEWEDALS